MLCPSLTSILGELLILTVSAAAAIASVGSIVVARGHLRASSVGLRRVSARWLLIGAGLGLVGWFLSRGVVLTYFWSTGDATNPQAGLVNAAQGTRAQFALTLLVAGLDGDLQTRRRSEVIASNERFAPFVVVGVGTGAAVLF